MAGQIVVVILPPKQPVSGQRPNRVKKPVIRQLRNRTELNDVSGVALARIQDTMPATATAVYARIKTGRDGPPQRMDFA